MAEAFTVNQLKKILEKIFLIPVNNLQFTNYLNFLMTIHMVNLKIWE